MFGVCQDDQYVLDFDLSEIINEEYQIVYNFVLIERIYSTTGFILVFFYGVVESEKFWRLFKREMKEQNSY